MPDNSSKRPIPTVMDVGAFQRRFGSDEACGEHLKNTRWGANLERFACPDCGHPKGWWLAKRKLVECCACHHQTSVTAGTVFHGARVSLWKWFWAMYQLAQDKKGIAVGETQSLFDRFQYSLAFHRALGSEEHDCVVPLPSQIADLTDPSNYTYITGQDGQHYPLIALDRSRIASDLAIQLLNAPLLSDVFAIGGFSGNFGQLQNPPPCTPVLARSAAGDGASVLLIAPSPGAVYESGAVVKVGAEVLPGSSVAHIAFVSSLGDTAFGDAPPFTAQFTLPLDFVGDVRISAVPIDAVGAFGSPVYADLVVQPTSPLLSLEINPKDLTLFPFSPESMLDVVGHFEDGVDRYLQGQNTGVSFQSKNERVAEVDANGIVRALRIGTTEIEATFEGMSASCAITVEGVRADANRDGLRSLGDMTTLYQCVSGPTAGVSWQVPSIFCREFFDTDGDTDVDLVDVAEFWRTFEGCVVADATFDGFVDLRDFAEVQNEFGITFTNWDLAAFVGCLHGPDVLSAN